MEDGVFLLLKISSYGYSYWREHLTHYILE